MESESCKQRQSKRRKEKSRKSKIFDPETGIESNNKDKEDAIKKEQEESTDDEDEDMNFRNNEIGLHNFQSNYVKNECEDSTEIIDQSCITSSESTVEQFDQLDVNTGITFTFFCYVFYVINIPYCMLYLQQSHSKTTQINCLL